VSEPLHGWHTVRREPNSDSDSDGEDRQRRINTPPRLDTHRTGIVVLNAVLVDEANYVLRLVRVKPNGSGD
jgi:hypothetical protein